LINFSVASVSVMPI